ncbi:MAG TPA: carboxypeptidase-like regulatory domain-containing protein, partial [Candidatus Acidoferrales bacterium]|nr:carboxypeptidase-like regulatory domain-containing protein [Candidatus Acidoferrales bacterium]
SLYGCGNSTPIDDAQFALKVIKRLKDRQGGVIQGLVTDGGFPSRTDVSRVDITVSGEKHEYKTVTNRKGEFKIYVPPGHYSVVPSRAGWKFTIDILSYEDPGQVDVQNGGGAQVQFQRDWNRN